MHQRHSVYKFLLNKNNPTGRCSANLVTQQQHFLQMISVPSEISDFVKKFNSKQVDVIAAEASHDFFEIV